MNNTNFFESEEIGCQFDKHQPPVTLNHHEKENDEFVFEKTKRGFSLNGEVNETEQRRKKHKTQSVLDAQVSKENVSLNVATRF